MQCPKCGHYNQEEQAKFCSQCSAALPVKEKKKYIGESRDLGTYRITFDPVEGEFGDVDAAYDAARHSSWGENREFNDYNVKFVKSAVPRGTYPYICNNCRQFVAENTEGSCGNCGHEEWVERTDETEEEKADYDIIN